jgi:thiol-disulfide isomerase/thioredoxin
MKCGAQHIERPIALLRRLIALALCLTVANPPSFADTREEVAIGETLRDVTLHGLNGPSRNLSAFRGKPLIINVWASWCGPCRREMASFERLAWRDQKQYFAIIGISTDDYADNANTFLQNSHATISQFIDSRLQMEKMLGASRLPLTVLVGADGRVLRKIYGAREWDDPATLQLIDATFHTRP